MSIICFNKWKQDNAFSIGTCCNKGRKLMPTKAFFCTWAKLIVIIVTLCTLESLSLLGKLSNEKNYSLDLNVGVVQYSKGGRVGRVV